MSALSRREFGKVLIAGAPLGVLGLGAVARAAAPGVILGVSTDSFRDLPRVQGADNVDDVIRALRAAGAGRVELDLADIEPAPPSTASFIGGTPAYPKRVTLTPEQILATNTQARGELRTWRLQSGLAAAQKAQQKFETAGLTLHACSLKYDASFTDEEIDLTLRQAKALGVSVVSSPMTADIAARVAPFAERHGVALAIHTQVEKNAEGLIAASELEAVLGRSTAFRVKLDAGNVTASNGDAVAELRRYQPRVSYVVMKDRLRNGGASQPFGEGDTPLAAVLGAMQTAGSGAPAMVEYDYIGLRTPVDEVTASLAYLTKALQRS